MKDLARNIIQAYLIKLRIFSLNNTFPNWVSLFFVCILLVLCEGLCEDIVYLLHTLFIMYWMGSMNIYEMYNNIWMIEKGLNQCIFFPHQLHSSLLTKQRIMITYVWHRIVDFLFLQRAKISFQKRMCVLEDF